MTYELFFKVMQDSGLSSEHFGKRCGIAGMTLRRWTLQPPEGDLPQKYETALIGAMYQLITEGKLDHNAESVQAVLKETASLSITAALKNLGVTMDDLKTDAGSEGSFLQLLTRIGMDPGRRRQVDGGSRALTYFEKLGRSWKSKLILLSKVIRSNKLTLTDKLVAYGALFYVITPFDLIPDYIPVVGLLDDYAVVMIAVAYYTRRYHKLFKEAGDDGVEALAAPAVDGRLAEF